ncbi:MAG: hypothetical protein U9Q66_03810 [Patescibacteria group bacterium]|nr:hypothetical protein [Patescibacteria group bacterium]
MTRQRMAKMTGKSKIIIIGGLGILLLTGCSSKYRVDFDSNPSGASLVCNGKNWGYTPKSLYYDKRVKNYRTMDVSSCSANWISGAKKNYPQNLTVFPGGATVITVQRPNVEGYEKDARFALEIQNSNYQRRQAKAAEDTADAVSYQNTLNIIRNNQMQLQNSKMQQQNYQLQNINNYMRYGY